MVKNALLMETSEAPRILLFLRQDLQTLEAEPRCCQHVTALRRSKVDGSWSGFADDLFIEDELPDHTAESAKHIILSTGRDAGGGQV